VVVVLLLLQHVTASVERHDGRVKKTERDRDASCKVVLLLALSR